METLEARPETTRRSPAAQPTAPRHDCYAGIHKALRLGVCRTLLQVGSADPQDPAETAAAAQAVRHLVAMSHAHLHKEDQFMHPLLEAALPGSTRHAQDEHQHHTESLDRLAALADRVEQAPVAQRAAALARLYQALAVFASEDFAHMHREETEHNAVLWAHYTDDELLDVERRIVAAIAPLEAMQLLQWFMPAFNAPERAGMLGGMRANAPAPVFDAACAVANHSLTQADWSKLARSLGIPAVPGLVSEARA
ncbi:hemerythrin domain-containing protein [Ramlibacter rhizophilus]|uniref:Hemerythrin-like domain-containing protein n=1 Tax=Ramlibacter rhizophilus TaxID=1781167 RepID=A0A4Z0C3A0_9BURK|nr:hemerythrin domain-containing protein [Ramlibacter rhizophilus]TFZ04950.1 hypothetical protein EZ242_04165 [Ramlibacter rhizophilus]